MLQASANPSAFFVAPETHNTDEKLAEFQAIAEQLVSNGRGALPHGTELKTIDLARPGSRPPFAERIDYCDRQIVLAATGGILTMLTESGSGTLAGGAHSDALFQLARSDAGKLSEAYQRHIDGPILRELFPGTPPVAYFEFDVPQTENTAKLLEAAANLNWAGYRVDQKQAQRPDSTGRSARARPGPSRTRGIRVRAAFRLRLDARIVSRWISSSRWRTKRLPRQGLDFDGNRMRRPRSSPSLGLPGAVFERRMPRFW